MENTDTQGQSYYQQPMHPSGSVSIGNWLLTILIMVIPLVNLIMLFVWAFGGGANESKANWAKASLIWMLIVIVIGILFGGTLLASFASLY